MPRLILFAFVIVFFTTCRKDKAFPPCDDIENPDCPNYDPCYGKNSVKADFNAYNYKNSISYSPYSDSVVFYVGRFVATESNANYTWIIDNTDTLSGYYMNYGFGNGWQMSQSDTGLHTVKLIVQKQPNTTCFPSDDGIDSISKQIFFKLPERAYICDYYKGSLNSNPSDSFIIRIAYNDPNLIPSQQYSYVHNLKNDGGYFMSVGVWYAQDRKLIINYNGNSQIGIMGLRSEVNPVTRILELDFDIENPNNIGTVLETRHFRGRKLN